MKILIRFITESDHNFIYATYLRNKYFDKANKTTLKRSTWSSLQHKRLETIMTYDLVLVACLEDDVDTIVGYGFMDGAEPWTYVKLDWRSPGLKVKDRLIKELTSR